MVGGGGNSKDDLVISNSNVFAALGSLRRKKKSDSKVGKSSASSSSSLSSPRKQAKNEEAKPQVFWAPAPLTAKSWADVDDEDDDDYYATAAPPQSVWGNAQEEESHPNPIHSSTPLEVVSCLLHFATSLLYCYSHILFKSRFCPL